MTGLLVNDYSQRNPPSLGEAMSGLLGNWGGNIEQGLLSALPFLAENDPYKIGQQLLREGAGVGGIAWHGSPHKYLKPDLSKMGTGEGAQAYGHGFYSAEARGVAEDYQKYVKDMEAITGYNDRMTDIVRQKDSLESIKFDWGNNTKDIQSKIDSLSKDYQTTMASRIAKVNDPGHLYKMNIPDETIGKMLDWDAPMSEQSEYVKGLLDIKSDPRKIELIDRYVAGSVKAGGDEKSVRKAVEEIMYGDDLNESAWDVITSNPEPFDPNEFHSFLTGERIKGVKRGMDLYSDLAGKGIDPKKTSKTFGYADRLEGAKYLKEAQQRFKDAPMSSGKGTYAPKVSVDGDNFVVDTYDQAGKTYGQQAASEYLNSLGIPGIKYLDGNSRAVGQGSRNFVSFTPDHIEMLERNGIPMKGLLGE